MKQFCKKLVQRLALLGVDILVLIGDAFEIIFKVLWQIRFGYMRLMTAIVTRLKYDRCGLDTWSTRLTELTKSDILDAGKINELRKQTIAKEES